MVEETISLAPEEYRFINQLDGKKFSKKRYSYEYEKGKFCEVDVYQDKLKGLVVIDFEFNSIEEKDNFKIPDFCLIIPWAKSPRVSGVDECPPCAKRINTFRRFPECILPQPPLRHGQRFRSNSSSPRNLLSPAVSA